MSLHMLMSLAGIQQEDLAGITKLTDELQLIPATLARIESKLDLIINELNIKPQDVSIDVPRETLPTVKLISNGE